MFCREFGRVYELLITGLYGLLMLNLTACLRVCVFCREFERMCELLADMSSGLELCWLQLAGWKHEKPKLYFVGMLGALLMLAWVGNNINNLFLAYLLAQWVVLYPGMKKRGLIKKYLAETILFITSRIRPQRPQAGDDIRPKLE